MMRTREALLQPNIQRPVAISTWQLSSLNACFQCP